jgi:DNA-binding transcriptional MerR regulator/methylmalonyl-CoA mutase cobalamin-binding subunit
MYTIKEASTRSGVGIPLLRAWERRYGVVVPSRSDAGYRLYDDAAIDRLRAMRHLIGEGWSARQAAERVRSATVHELAELAAPRPASTADANRVGIDGGVAEQLIARLVDAARRIDGRALESALDETFSTSRFEVAMDRVVMPAMRAIGEGWERGEVDVAGEHAASHAVLRRLAMAYEGAGDPGAERPVLIGLGPGSHHELGAFAFAIAARRAGLPVLYLGPDLPVDSWVTAAETRAARGAVLGAPSVTDARRARDVIRALRAARPEMTLAVGGSESGRVSRATGALDLPPGAISESVAALRSALRDGSAQAAEPTSG